MLYNCMSGLSMIDHITLFYFFYSICKYAAIFLLTTDCVT